MMYTRLIPVLLMCMCEMALFAQGGDSIRQVELHEVTIEGVSQQQKIRRASALSVEVADSTFLSRHFSGNLTQTIEYLPGVRSMDIGSGFSKPMIRGMGFNRIVVAENGIKQEGQQWGSDHGLEIDAFNVERLTVSKGPMSLAFGSDGMGGAIEVAQLPAPVEDQFYGEATLLTKTVNNNLGGSLMLGIKKKAFHAKVRYSEQHYGDYRVPTDTIVYLTQLIPIYGRRLKNTAGYERNINLFGEYRHTRYYSNYAVSNAYQKSGFFPGAHGIPDASRVQDDGDHRNIELPYSTVNHFKVTTRQQYSWNGVTASWDAGFQRNHRVEWSQFHTHYGNQSAPEADPDKELEFTLNTWSSAVKLKTISDGLWNFSGGWDVQYQQNNIDGYSFLLPAYHRFTTGLFGIATRKFSDKLTVSGGLRYDYGHLHSSAYQDEYLEAYLRESGYSETLIADYMWRSYLVSRSFGDFSGSIGLVWTPDTNQTIKVNVGRSFRLPGANELASNGVHHGTFRHERGDATLASEKGWQVDASYDWEHHGLSVSVSPFASWFSNYIYLKPTGEWSVLPHAGQIYRYAGAKAVFLGAEVSLIARLCSFLTYSLQGEYVYTNNRDEETPLSFSPPASMRNTLSATYKGLEVNAEWQLIARQDEVSKNEAVTAGAGLVHLGGSYKLHIGKQPLNFSAQLRNVFNKKYYNHLSFYRKVEIPEPGRNLQLTIHIPFSVM